jgi:hypothetical protein
MLFPTTCVDSFFDNPKAVRELAYSLERAPDPEGNWPGSRTGLLHEVAPDYHAYFSDKLFRLFYNFNVQEVSWVVHTCFQFIEPYSQNKNVNVGWVHKDINSMLSGVIYLNENPEINSGTSLYTPNRMGVSLINGDYKKEFFKASGVFDEDEYVNKLNENNSLFTETLTVGNVYNRMVCYDGSSYHKANGFTCGDEPRLTQVFFVRKIMADWYPVPNMRSV